MGITTEMHRSLAPKNVRAAVITVSDSKSKTFARGDKTGDESGKIIMDELRKKGHEVVFYTVVPDDKEKIVDAIDVAVADYFPNVIITTGGTGISKKDVTIEAVESLFEKKLDGFGEVFRRVSYDTLGTAAFLSRAVAGVYGSVAIFSMPGSPDAVKTGMDIIAGELTHLVKHMEE